MLRVEEIIAEERAVQAAVAMDSDAALATAPWGRPPLRRPWTRVLPWQSQKLDGNTKMLGF